MKSFFSFKTLAFAVVLTFAFTSKDAYAQNERNNIPWTQEQEMDPVDLAALMNSGKADNILIVNAGPVNDIKGAVNIGPLTNEESQANLDVILKDLPKDKEIVVYCGCCPMKVCPNIRPAYQFLTDRGVYQL